MECDLGVTSFETVRDLRVEMAANSTVVEHLTRRINEINNVDIPQVEAFHRVQRGGSNGHVAIEHMEEAGRYQEEVNRYL